MSFLDGVRGKLNQANDALADAHKGWRDERLDAREAALKHRESIILSKEADVAARLDEVRSSEARWFRRKVGFGSGAIIGAIPALILGIAVGAGQDAAIQTEAGSRARPLRSLHLHPLRK
jgi:hypothetical protein